MSRLTCYECERPDRGKVCSFIWVVQYWCGRPDRGMAGPLGFVRPVSGRDGPIYVDVLDLGQGQPD